MPKGRNTSRHQGKRSSTIVLVLAMLLMLTLVLLMLLALGILSLPVTDDDSPPIQHRFNFGRKDRVSYVKKSVSLEIGIRHVCLYIYCDRICFDLIGVAGVVVTLMVWGRDWSSGQKLFLGSLERLFITTSWLVSFEPSG